VETYLSAAVSVVALMCFGWRVLRGLARFVGSVETNTRAVARPRRASCATTPPTTTDAL
jgi:hypothetical protein